MADKAFVEQIIKSAPDFISVHQASRILGCSDRTISRMVDDGRLKGIRVGNRRRVRLDSFLEYIGFEYEPSGDSNE